MVEQEKRDGLRPSNPNRKQRINVTFSPETLIELEQRVPFKKRSAFIERLVRQALGLEREEQNNERNRKAND